MMAYLRCLQSVNASSGETKNRRVRPVDLDIYFEPQVEGQAFSEETVKAHALQKYVSVVRKQLWRFKDVTVNAYNTTETAVVDAKNGIVSTFESAKSDPLSMVRPGCITAAVIAGAAVQGRGRKPFLRFTSATIAGSLVGSVAYPDKALKIAKVVYFKTKDASLTVADRMRKMAEKNSEPKEGNLIAVDKEEDTGLVIDERESDLTGEFPDIVTNEAAPDVLRESKTLGIDLSQVADDQSSAEKSPLEVVEIQDNAPDFSVQIVKDAHGEEICLIDIPKERIQVNNPVYERTGDLPGKEGTEEVTDISQSIESLNDVAVEMQEIGNMELVENESIAGDEKHEMVESTLTVNDIPERSQIEKEETSGMSSEEKVEIQNEVNDELPPKMNNSSAEGHEDSKSSLPATNIEVIEDEKVDYGQSSPEDKDMYSTRG